jgi:hypothetical protein
MESCPKCAFALEPGAVDCPACGVVLSKFLVSPPAPTLHPSLQAIQASRDPRLQPSAPPVPVTLPVVLAPPVLTALTIQTLEASRPWIKITVASSYIFGIVLAIVGCVAFAMTLDDYHILPWTVFLFVQAFLILAVARPLDRAEGELLRLGSPSEAVEAYNLQLLHCWRRSAIANLVFLMLFGAMILLLLVAGKPAAAIVRVTWLPPPSRITWLIITTICACALLAALVLVPLVFLVSAPIFVLTEKPFMKRDWLRRLLGSVRSEAEVPSRVAK